MTETEELQHWGILGMKWGIRNYQNPDGSLTPAGRIRYGVGEAKNLSNNVGSKMSDEEIRKMTRRYRAEAEFYNARNDSIRAEANYRELTTPKKRTNTFFYKSFTEPTQQLLGKTVQFAEYGVIDALLKSFGINIPENYTEQYLKYAFSINNDKKKDDNKKKDNDSDSNNSKDKSSTTNNYYYYNQPDNKENNSSSNAKGFKAKEWKSEPIIDGEYVVMENDNGDFVVVPNQPLLPPPSEIPFPKMR